MFALIYISDYSTQQDEHFEWSFVVVRGLVAEKKSSLFSPPMIHRFGTRSQQY